VSGSGSFPTVALRMHASYPLVVLELADGRLTLRLRPRLAGTLFGAQPLSVQPADLKLIYPIRGKRVVSVRGVGFRTPDNRDWYFFVSPVTDILTALHASGFPVTDVAEVATKIWRAVP
jgi:hypothetical protein